MVRITKGRVGLVIGAGFLAVAALYGIGANLLLSTGALARILSAHPGKLRVEYARARTLWPGRVHVEGLDVRGRSAHLEWQLHIDSADADIALFALLVRRFHVEDVAAHGVSFRARFRLEAKDVTDDRIARIPPIAGLDAVPLLDPEDEASQPPPVRSDSFTVQLEQVQATAVREVWIDAFRLTGDLAAAGGFQLGPRQRLEVTPSRVHVTDATLAVGDDVVFASVHGGADATIEPFDMEAVKGVNVLRSLTTHSDFVARVGGLGFLRHFIEDKAVTVEEGAGSFSGLLVLDRGRVKAGSRSHVELGEARVTVAGRVIAARSVVDLVAGEDDSGGWATGEVALSSVALTQPGEAHPSITSPSMSLKARVAVTDLAEPPRDFSYSCDAPRIELEELSWIDALLPKDGSFHIDAGRATVGVRARGSMEEATADMAVASSTSLRMDEARAGTAIEANVHCHARFEARTLDLSGTTVQMDGLAVAGSPARGGWWGKAKLDSAEIRLVPPIFTATIATSARDARPILSLYAAMRHTSPAVTLALALVPDPFVEAMTADLRGSLRIRAATGSLDIHALELRGAQTDVRGELTRRGDEKRGGLLFVAGPASAGVSFDGRTASPVLIDAAGWFGRSVAKVGAP